MYLIDRGKKKKSSRAKSIGQHSLENALKSAENRIKLATFFLPLSLHSLSRAVHFRRLFSYIPVGYRWLKSASTLLREMGAPARGKCLCGAENWQTRRPWTIRVFRIQQRFRIFTRELSGEGEAAPSLPPPLYILIPFWPILFRFREKSHSFGATNSLNFPFENERKHSIFMELITIIIIIIIGVSLYLSLRELFKLNNMIRANLCDAERKRDF